MEIFRLWPWFSHLLGGPVEKITANVWFRYQRGATECWGHMSSCISQLLVCIKGCWKGCSPYRVGSVGAAACAASDAAAMP